MRRRILAVAVLAILVTAAAATMRLHTARAHAVAGTGGGAGPIDTAKTLRYVEDWARRGRWDRFPESPSFAYYNLYATRALGGVVTPERRAQVIEYLRKCQAPDGGFTAAPGAGDSHVVPTLYALRALALAGALDTIDRSRAATFVAGLAHPRGGYRGRAGDVDASLGTTFHAIAALELLGAVDRADRAGTAAYVSSHRDADGGFALRPGMAATPGSTFMAVRSLKILGALDAGTAAAVARHLARSRYSGNLRDVKFATAPEIEDEANVLSTLADIGRPDLVDAAQVERFVQGLYVPENGGFGPQPGLGTTPPSTYQAIACLVALGRLPDPVRG